MTTVQFPEDTVGASKELSEEEREILFKKTTLTLKTTTPNHQDNNKDKYVKHRAIKPLNLR